MLANMNTQALRLFLLCAGAGPDCLWRRKALAHMDNLSRRLGHFHNAARCTSHALFEDHSPTIGESREKIRETNILSIRNIGKI